MFENFINNWTAAMDGFRLLRTDGLGRPGGGLALYVKEKQECMEYALGRVRSQSRVHGSRLVGRPTRVLL